MKKSSIIILLLNLFIVTSSIYIIFNNKKEKDIALSVYSAIINNEQEQVNQISLENNFESFKKDDTYLLKFSNNETFRKKYTLFQKMMVIAKSKYRDRVKVNLLNFDTQEKIRTSDCLEIKSKCILSIERIK